MYFQYFKLATILTAAFLLSGSAVFAQNSPATPFDQVKQEIADLFAENTRLEEEYKELKSRVLGVQSDINTYKMENKSLEQELEQTKNVTEKQRYTRDSLTQKIELLKKEIAGNEEKSGALETELGSYDEKLKAWQAKIADLENQKTLLTAQLQEEEAQRQRILKGEAEEIKALKDQLSAMQGDENNVLQAIEASQQENQKAMEEIEILKNENKNLESQIADLQRDKEMKVRENAELQKQTESVKMSPEYTKKLQEKKAVEARIKNLEGELESVRKSLESSVGLQAQKRGLVDQIMTVDKENQELRNKVSELKAAVDAAKSK